MCSDNDILESLHNAGSKSEASSILRDQAENIAKYADNGDVEFFIALGQLLEQM